MHRPGFLFIKIVIKHVIVICILRLLSMLMSSESLMYFNLVGNREMVYWKETPHRCLIMLSSTLVVVIDIHHPVVNSLL